MEIKKPCLNWDDPKICSEPGNCDKCQIQMGECSYWWTVMSDLRTSEEWSLLCNVIIHDPDGWNRHGDFHYSWFEEKITRIEFEQRMIQSTCAWSAKESIWKDGTENGCL